MNNLIKIIYLLVICVVDYLINSFISEGNYNMAIAPMAIPAALGVAKAGVGAYQMWKGSKMKAERPTMEVQPEHAQNVSMIENQMYGQTAGDKYAEQGIRQSTQNIVQQASKYARSGSDVLSMLGGAQAQEMGAMRGETMRREQRQVSLMGALSAARNKLAEEKQRAWDYNLRQKYEEDAAAKAAMKEAGMRNIEAGVTDVAGAAMQGGMGGSGGSFSPAPQGLSPRGVLQSKKSFSGYSGPPNTLPLVGQ